ncbi:MAG: V-type ATP synthase subunit I [Candidatus Merdivicinus sp.]|jgi:V/A-type H+-transporting ATPase subunit I
MIVPMKKVLLVALREDKDALAQALQRIGEVMPVDAEGAPAAATGSQEAARAEQALKVVRQYQGKQGMFALRPEVGYTEFVAGNREAEELLGKIEALHAEDEAAAGEIAGIQAKIQELLPWLPMDISMEEIGTTRFSGVRSGYVERSRADEAKLAAEEGGGVLQLLDSGPQGTAVLLYTYLAEEDGLLRAVSAAGFSEAAPPGGKGFPKDLCDGYQARIGELNARREEIARELTLLAGRKTELELLRDQREAEEARQDAPFGETVETVFLEGWVRSDRTARVEKAVARVTDCYELTFREPEEGEKPPTVTKNNRFISQFETITDMFSRPSNGELDPNPVMGPWYWIIFGLMMGDAGYGLLMLIGIWAFKKLKKPRGDFGKLVNVLFFSSITTIFWGIIFGSYFGETWRPILFAPLDNPMGMLAFCMIIGVLHIFSGMIMKMVEDAKAGRFWDGIFDQLSWMLLITGLGLLFLPAARTVGVVLAIVGAAVILLTAGRAKKGIFGKIIGGFGGLYNITSYMSDILSYSRILALSLATGVVGMVMNLLAGMVQGSVIGFVFSLLIYAVGHIFNLAMGLLSAYVHDSRLQYIEFFNKFYEGGGYAFRPLRIDPRYVEVIDQNDSNQGGN